MADVVVTTGVHATGDVQVQLADVEQVVQVVETALDRFGDRDRLGVGQGAEITPRAADDVGQQADVRRGEAAFTQFAPQGEQLALLNVCQDDVLLVGGAQLAEAVAFGQVGHGVQLLVGDIARGDAGGLERQGHGHIARLFVRQGVAHTPAGKAWVLLVERGEFGVLVAQGLVLGVDEMLGDAMHFGFGQGGLAAAQVFHLGVYLLGEHLGGQRLDQDLDPGLVFVVATAVAVVDPQDRVEVAQQVRPWQKLVDERADHWRTAQAATHQHTEAQFACGVVHRLQADVVDFDGRTVRGRAVDGDLELARQVGEFRVEGGPLTDDFAPRARVDQFVGGNAGELVGGHVTQAVAAGLNGVHLHGRQLSQDVRHIFQCRPVELHVLAGTDVGVAFVEVAGNLGHHACLARSQLAVGHGHPQHRRKALHIKAILQAQRAELFFAQFTCQIASGLITELLDAVLDDALIVFVVYVHIGPVLGKSARTAAHSQRSRRTIPVCVYAQK
ncbi:hypothetical protein [Pseudomonas sp. 22 E 5]|nr:hypothetical protein [Pseudomonas sp. 22 E 5]CRM97806.1 hypothetical protein [Pseudomonas sp. 22 E 5]